MHKSIIISDASPIIALENIGRLDILRTLYEEIIITDIVAEEVQMELPDWVRRDSSYDKDLYVSLSTRLDEGEASAIALAVQKKDCLLIIDEKKGRKLAKELGVEITGLIGVIVKAKGAGIIDSGKLVLNELEENGFRISDSLKTIKKKLLPRTRARGLELKF